jgi:hypothetical protein
MTPQEFREAYLESQNDLGNHLQTLTDLTSQFEELISLISADYSRMNEVVDEFISRQENQQQDGGQA